jgi:LuxR family maltose regulon positive regulatory protein
LDDFFLKNVTNRWDKNHFGGYSGCKSYPTAYNKRCWVTFAASPERNMPDPNKSMVNGSVLTMGSVHVQVGSQAWYEWLSGTRKFSFKGEGGHFIAQCETRRNKSYWYAYRRRNGKLSKVYLGKTEELTLKRLEQASLSLTGPDRFSKPAVGNEALVEESRIDTSFLPMSKVNVPILPRQLVSRPRLIQQINTPLTLIYAPSGFGKSTLLNDWKQLCGHPVAWLSLDENDNQPIRFWYSIVLALQTVDPRHGRELLAYLGTSSSIQIPEIVSHLTNDIVRASLPRLGLVLDDFHRIHNSKIYDFLQAWLEQFPPTMQLVISGHIRPPLSLGHLRARGLLTELDASALRFTLEEEIQYLQQYPQEPPLARSDMEKLARHTEGWAAGLTLTALALGKHEDRRQFIDTFSGAHIYLREYFLETVLQRSPPEVQDFLLKTAILKHMTGSLCDALTGRTDGAEMLSHLWDENLFIVQLEQQGWYRYHDLFAEMLCSQLQACCPDEIPQLHQRAAQWYREQFAPADAIHHLLATEAWEEAASLMEEMALRELEQFGEDSRLLRWLQELPESVFQKHKTLLFVYLRLASLALPQKKMERFVKHIEDNLTSQPASQRTQDERDVLFEIQQVQQVWAQGNTFVPPSQNGNAHETKWEVLNGLHLLKPVRNANSDLLIRQITDLLFAAQVQHNLFVILMAGGVLARQMYVNGQIRRCEKIARQVLEQALAQRGKLPEPASIALAALSQAYLARNELDLAQKYLDQTAEVDPNPTSSNMLVQTASLRARTQVAQGRMDEACLTIQAIRELHLRRPSGAWNDQDLIAYEAFIHLRKGDVPTAEQLLKESPGTGEHPFSQLAQAEVYLGKGQSEAAENLLSRIIAQHPNGIQFEPLMGAQVLLALALFEQHKINQSRQVMADALRLAAPERFILPFLEHGAKCSPLLTLVLQTESLTREAQSFIREILRLCGQDGKSASIPQNELDALSMAASISAREQGLLNLMSRGCSNREMAEKLCISESTVKTHLGNIYYKLSVNSRVLAVARAKELKLV